MKLVYLEWEDASSDGTHSWMFESQLNHWLDNSDFIVATVGWIYREDDRTITLAATRKMPDKQNSETAYGEITRIPKGWIRKRKVIKL